MFDMAYSKLSVIRHCIIGGGKNELLVIRKMAYSCDRILSLVLVWVGEQKDCEPLPNELTNADVFGEKHNATLIVPRPTLPG
jgi:hypothetical protein